MLLQWDASSMVPFDVSFPESGTRVDRWRDLAYRSHHDPLTPYSFDLRIAAVTAPAA